MHRPTWRHGCRRWAGTPLGELGRTFVDLGDLAGRHGRRLGDTVRELGTWSERFAALDEFLLRRIGGRAAASEVRLAWRRLVSGAGSAERVPGARHRLEPQAPDHQIQTASRPHPQDRGPAAALEHVWRSLRDGEPAHWDRIAADDGYADQSHLVRDFRQFTGGTPGDFLARSSPGAPAQSGHDAGMQHG